MDQQNLWQKDLNVYGQNVRFKLDAGSEANIIPMRIFKQLQVLPLKPAKCHLVTYMGQQVRPEGETMLDINNRMLRFQVTTTGSPILRKDACVNLK